jgi:UDP-N-acetylmuramoyl-L-alanyl-D-glutamate--2,6-diaminopimelate ligase
MRWKRRCTRQKITSGRILTVFGCGGDRDRGKRAEMGRVAGKHSHKVFITSDNPRSEDPAAIAHEIEKGVIASGQKNYVIELEREKAIKWPLKPPQKKTWCSLPEKGMKTTRLSGKVKTGL